MSYQNTATAWVMVEVGCGMHINSIRDTKRQCILDFPMNGMVWSEFKMLGFGYEVKKIEIRVL